MPKKGISFSLACFMAIILFSIPASPNPPGTTIPPFTDLSLYNRSFSLIFLTSIQLNSTFLPNLYAECFNASTNDIYASPYPYFTTKFTTTVFLILLRISVKTAHFVFERDFLMPSFSNTS